jgi:hypothetical protein
MSEKESKEWCFFEDDEGDGFGPMIGRFATREDAIVAALEHGIRERCHGLPNVLVGTRCDPNDLVGVCLDDLLEQMADNMRDDHGFEDCGIYLLDGGADAFFKWLAEYVRCDLQSACIDGTPPTAEEWEAAHRAYDAASKGA